MRIRYQTAFFADLAHLGATPQNTLRILQRFTAAGIEVIPSTVPEVAPPMLTVEQRPSFTSADGTLTITVGRGRLDIWNNAASFDGPDLPPIQHFIALSQNCLNCVLEDTSVLGHRLALTTLIAHQDMSSADMDEKFRMLCRPPGSMGDSPPHDWSLRIGMRRELSFGGRAELSNVIMRTSRSQLQHLKLGAAREIERMTTELDINTLAENAEPRFPHQIGTEFLHSAAEKAAQIEQDLRTIGLEA